MDLVQGQKLLLELQVTVESPTKMAPLPFLTVSFVCYTLLLLIFLLNTYCPSVVLETESFSFLA